MYICTINSTSYFSRINIMTHFIYYKLGLLNFVPFPNKAMYNIHSIISL